MRHSWRLIASLELVVLCVTVPAREVPITIVYTTDLHGCYLPPSPGTGPTDSPGLLKAAPIIRRWRAERPDLILLDLGDTFQGAPESFVDRGQGMAIALRSLKYDAWIPGNHDFDWGGPAFTAFARALPCPTLAANLAAGPLPATESTATPMPWMIRSVQGVRIAIIGLTHPLIPRWHAPERVSPYRVAPGLESVRTLLPRLRTEHPDILILATHQGLTADSGSGDTLGHLVRLFPDLDVVLGGHTHTNVPGVLRNGVLYSQAGFHGNAVGRTDLWYDDEAHRVIRKTARVVDVGMDAPTDSELGTLLRTHVLDARRRLEVRVGESAVSLAGDEPPSADESGRVEQLLQAAILDASGAVAVFHGRLCGARLKAGPITEEDLWRIVPYENRIGVLLLTGEEIHEVANELTGVDDDREPVALAGIICPLSARTKAGNRVGWPCRIDGQPLAADIRIPVAFNSHMLASAGGRFPRLADLARRPETRIRWLETDMRDTVRAYLQRHRPLTVRDLPTVGLQPVSRSGRKAAAGR